MRPILYIVQEYCIQDWEIRWRDYHVYYHEHNALEKLRCIKEQDMMPIVDEENYNVHWDSPRHFEAGREGDFAKAMVCVRVIETPLLDYEIGDNPIGT